MMDGVSLLVRTHSRYRAISNRVTRGLDVAAKRQILEIMERRNVNFDEARRIFVSQKFARNGIGADGQPTGIFSFFPPHGL